jgi:hypothetical protein
MLRHKRERFKVEEETLRRALRPELGIAFGWQGVVRRIDLDRIKAFRIEPQPFLGASN